MATITTRAEKGAPLTNTELDANFANLNTEVGGKQDYDADIPTVSASQAEMEAGTEASLRSMSPLRVAQAIAALGGGGGGGVATVTTTAVDKTIAAGEACFVTASGKTITLPASPSAGEQIIVGVNNFSDTVIARNGKNIMSLAENLTVDQPNISVTLLYVDTTIGWKIV